MRADVAKYHICSPLPVDVCLLSPGGAVVAFELFVDKAFLQSDRPGTLLYTRRRLSESEQGVQDHLRPLRRVVSAKGERFCD